MSFVINKNYQNSQFVGTNISNAACILSSDGKCNANLSIKQLDEIIENQKAKFKSTLPVLIANGKFDENFVNPYYGWEQWNDPYRLIKANKIGDSRSDSLFQQAPTTSAFAGPSFVINYVDEKTYGDGGEEVNAKVKEIQNLASAMEKFYNIYRGDNKFIKAGQNAFETKIQELDALSVDENFINSLGEELANEVINTAENNIEQFHIYNHIPNNKEIQEFKNKRQERGYIKDPSGNFDVDYYVINNDGVWDGAYALMGVTKDEEGNLVYKVKNLYEIAKYADSPYDFDAADRTDSTAFKNYVNTHYADRVLNSDNTFNENYYVIRGSAPRFSQEDMSHTAVANILSSEDKDYIARQYLDIGAPVEYDMIQTGEDEEGNPILEPRDPERILDSGFDLETQYQDQSEFAKDVLISDRPENVSSAEVLINEKVGDKVREYFQQYEALSRDSLQKTIDAMKKQRQNEAAIDMLGGIGSIRELKTFGEDIAEQIMGGFNVGGFNPMQPKFDELADKLKTDFEKFSPFSKSKNNVIYNWQKWFGETFDEGYGRAKFTDILDEALGKDSQINDFQREIITNVGNHFQSRKSKLFGTPQEILNRNEYGKYALQRENKDILKDVFMFEAGDDAAKEIAYLAADNEYISKGLGKRELEDIIDSSLENLENPNVEGNELLKKFILEIDRTNGTGNMGGLAKDQVSILSDTSDNFLNSIGLNSNAFSNTLQNKVLYQALKGKIDNNSFTLGVSDNTYKGSDAWFNESDIKDDRLKKILQITLRGLQPEGANINSFKGTDYEAPAQSWNSYGVKIDPSSNEYGPLTYAKNSWQGDFWKDRYVQLPEGAEVSNVIAQFYEPENIKIGNTDTIKFTLKDEYKNEASINGLQLPFQLAVNRPDIVKTNNSVKTEWGEKIFNSDVLKELGYDTSSQAAIVQSSRALSDEIKSFGNGKNLNPNTGRFDDPFTSGDILHDIITGETLDYDTKDIGFSASKRQKNYTIENLQTLFNKVSDSGFEDINLVEPTYQYLNSEVLQNLGYGSFENKKDLDDATKKLLKDLEANNADSSLINLIKTDADITIPQVFDYFGNSYGNYNDLLDEVNSYKVFKNTATYSPKTLEMLGVSKSFYGDYTKSFSALRKASNYADAYLKNILGSNYTDFKKAIGAQLPYAGAPVEDLELSTEEMISGIDNYFGLQIDFDDTDITVYNPEILKAAGFSPSEYGVGNFEANQEAWYKASKDFKKSLQTGDAKNIELNNLLSNIQKTSQDGFGTGTLNINDVVNTLNRSAFNYKIDLLDKEYEMYDPEFLIDMGYLTVPEGSELNEDYEFSLEDIYQAGLRFENDVFDEFGQNEANKIFGIIDSSTSSAGIRNAINYTNNSFNTDIDPLTLEQFYLGEGEDAVAIDYEFAQNFIQEFLEPRFDYSESMDEFISYMEVDAANQNILQKIDTLRKAREDASRLLIDYTEKLEKYGELAKEFNPEFYMNPLATDKGYPLINQENKGILEQQQRQIAEDYESFKQSFGNLVPEKSDITWGDIAYQFGINPEEAKTNPDLFAKLHYEAYGKSKDFLGTSFPFTQTDIETYLNTVVADKLEKVLQDSGSMPFGKFQRVEDYVDDYLDGIILNDEAYERVLKVLGFLEENENIEDAEDILLGDVKEQFIEVLRTVPAGDIREQIERLEKLKEEPTQLNLGIFYIPREDVFKDYETLDANGKPIELSGEENYLSEIVSKLAGEEREKLIKHLGYKETPSNEQLKVDLLKVLQMQNNWEVRELKRDLDDLVGGTNTLLSEKLVVPTDEELQDYLNRIKAKDEEKPESVFYQMFKEAGYTGDEDTFYEEIFPDADRSEMDLLSKLLRGEEEGGLKLDIASKMQDPWNALSFAESLSSDVDDDDDEPATNPFSFLERYSSGYKIMDEKEEEDDSSFLKGLFDLDLDDDDDGEESTSTKDPFIDSFMSLFS